MVMTRHQFRIERIGHGRQGSGGKPAETRHRSVCECGFETKWRKYLPAVEEDRNEHLNAAEAAGDEVIRGYLPLKRHP
jgi:hypothetical protein